MAETEARGRTIGLFGATIIGVGAIVGGGVLALAGQAFSNTGPSTVLAFVLNAVIALMTAASFAEMTTAFPESGGAYAFTKKVLNVRAAFAVGWILWFASIAAAILYALGFAAFALKAVAVLWPGPTADAPAILNTVFAMKALAVVAIAFYTVILTRSKGGGGNVETIGKLVVFGIIILAGLWAFARSDMGESMKRMQPFMPGGASGLFTAMGFTFIALQGFDIIAAAAGEVKNPRRNMPRSMFISLMLALLVYIPLLMLVATVGVSEGSTIQQMGTENPDTMIATAIGNFMGPWGFWMVMIAAVLSMLSALYANLMASSRFALAMSSDRTLPRLLSTLSPSTGNPINAVLISSAITCIIMLMVPNVGAAGAAASLIFLLSFTLTHVTAILARRRGGIPMTAFRVPFFPLVPGLGMLFCAGLAIYQAFAAPPAGIIVTVWLVIGFILYFTTLAPRAEVLDARSVGTDPTLSQLRGRSPLVLVPMANPNHARAMVETANAISPPTVGRVLLHTVVQRLDPDATAVNLGKLQQTQDLLGQALAAALMNTRVTPEALITMSDDIWGEIRRVVRVHRCESLLLGLSDLKLAEAGSPMENLITTVDCDVVVIRAPDGWTVDGARRILVPVGGGGAHDPLRARLLGSLCRSAPREITFVRIVPETMNDTDLRRVESTLRQEAHDESPVPPKVHVERADDPLAAVVRRARESDLVILGMQKGGAGRVIGPFAREVAKASSGATILISHND